MKRLLTLLSAVLVLSVCQAAARGPVIKSYRLEQVSGLRLGVDGVTADMVLSIDVENPTAAKYTILAMEAIVYRGEETASLADVTSTGTAVIKARSDSTITLPLTVRITRPLALLAGGLNEADLSQCFSDVDFTIRRGWFKKHVRRKHFPLQEFSKMLSTQKSKTNEMQ